MEGRSIGLDVHRDFCEVAVCQAGKVAHWPRVSARPGPLKEFAEQLRPDDRVALEATGNALAIARIIRPHVKEVVIVNTRQLQAIANSKQKTDRHDAKTLAQLLAAGMLEHSWLPDEGTRATRRRVDAASEPRRRSRDVQERGARGAASQPQAPPADDRRLRRRRPRVARRSAAPADERDTIDAALRQIDFLTEEIETIEHDLAEFVLASPDARRLLTVPGVGMITAAVFLAQTGTARGDINRFTSPTAAGRLPRPGPARAPIRQRTRPHRPDLQRRRRRGPARPRRVRPHRRPITRPAARVLPARPRSPRAPDRDRRDRPQDGQAVLAPPHPRTGLRLHAPDRARQEDPHDRAQSRPRPHAAPAATARPQPRATPSDRAADRRTRPSRLRTHRSPTGNAQRRKNDTGASLTFIRPFAISFSAWFSST